MLPPMKIPDTPPPFDRLMKEVIAEPKDFIRIMEAGVWKATIEGEKYVHWDRLRHHTHPKRITTEQWWAAIKMARRSISRVLPSQSTKHEPFTIAFTDPLHRYLSEADRDFGGRVSIPQALENPDTRDRYRISASIEEAVTSSQLEGATTTRKVAVEMLRTGRQPTDKSERMIYNNYRAIRFIRKIQDQPLTPNVVMELHSIVTDQTLDDPNDAGRLRTKEVAVYGSGPDENVVYHVPPQWTELPKRLQALCDFANEKTELDFFLHPIVRAILLHFGLAYDHPFMDGNGRTARALFYWSMARSRYWLCEYLSISHFIKKAPAEYALSYLYTETDDNDTTYFVLSQLGILKKALEALHDFVRVKMRAMNRAQKILRQSQAFNHRQLALLGHAMQHPDATYSARGHATSHDVSTVTARADLVGLAKAKLLVPVRAGVGFIYTVPPDMEERLESLGEKASGTA
jgi:Fic family protein